MENNTNQQTPVPPVKKRNMRAFWTALLMTAIPITVLGIIGMTVRLCFRPDHIGRWVVYRRYHSGYSVWGETQVSNYRRDIYRPWDQLTGSCHHLLRGPFHVGMNAL